MAKRTDLLTSIAEITSDYRHGDLGSSTPNHVERWVTQFNSEVQVPILREMNHVLKQTYYSRKKIREYLAGLFRTKALAGDDPCTFWKKVKFFDIQGGGTSQKKMLVLFSKILSDNCGFEVGDCGREPEEFIYLDDATFTGNRVRRDIEAWITEDAPVDAKLHIVVIATHAGRYFHVNKISETVKSTEKRIKISNWIAVEFEDRKKYNDTSDVLRPVEIPDDPAVQDYVNAMHHKPEFRNAGQIGGNGIFSGDAGRQLLEQEFLKAGVRIREMCPNLSESQRPLGYTSLETLGFGSLIVTFMNCPNNAPLVLWVGNPWYPLFPRSIN